MTDDPLHGLGGDPPAEGAKRVTRTGIALVHEGELVLPAPGSEAEAITTLEDAGTAVHLWFPVEIELRAVTLDPPDLPGEIDERMRRLARRLAALR